MTNDIGRRSRLSKAAIACRVAALAAFVIAIVNQQGWRWALLVMGLGLLLVPLAWRQKASSAPGARWSASADLLDDTRRWPGQLSLTEASVVWEPSHYSADHGQVQLTFHLDRGGAVRLQAGPALFDVFVDVETGNGRTRRFVTHRTPKLRTAVREIAASD